MQKKPARPCSSTSDLMSPKEENVPEPELQREDCQAIIGRERVSESSRIPSFDARGQEHSCTWKMKNFETTEKSRLLMECSPCMRPMRDRRYGSSARNTFSTSPAEASCVKRIA